MTLAYEIMDIAAGLLNDPAKEIHPYSVQFPYLRVAMRELKEVYQLHNIPITNEVTDSFVVPANTSTIGFTTTPALPPGLVTVRKLLERELGKDSWSEVHPRTFLAPVPNPTTLFGVYSWINGEIRVLPLTKNHELKIEYIQSVFADLTDENSLILVSTGISFLEFRTAGLMAEFIDEDKPRGESLTGNAGLAIDRALGIEVKPGQQQAVRRRPFRSNYKNRR